LQAVCCWSSLRSLTWWTAASPGRITQRASLGAVFDWVADKYVDAAVILGVGLSGIPIVSHLLDVPASADLGVVGLALAGSLLNTFIKPVTYAEIGYTERIAGKIEDLLRESASSAGLRRSLFWCSAA